MKIFKNAENKTRSGWKIGLIFISFIVTTTIATFIFSVGYGVIIVVNHSEVLSDQVKFMQYIQKQFSGMSNFPAVCLQLIQCISLILLVILFWKIWDKGKVREIGLTNIKSSWKDLCVGLLIGAVSFTIVAFILLITKSVEMVNSFGSPKFSGVLITQLIIFIFVGINEELFCRGYCMTVLKQTKKSWIPVVVSAIIFSLMHSMNGGISLLAYINLFLFGILMGYLFMKTKNIWMCIGYHITWNYFQGDIFGFLVSGSTTESIYSIKVVSPNLINGGSFGPEGGLVVTALLIVTTFLVYKFIPNRKSAEVTF
ncbi:CAAX amino terminal protease self- immunity [Clostridium puniceum]|uniref:CAAX amino terminal protease self-immunity n=1 Tax=Clostridium puniceum TaxID=29367 RepID=A0A1S8T6L2_9CLOT|nr:CPBP family intramembrane glutamic endopeptidase [Clostridium puniceum]OOM73396.1 CAAX amino terminal protease self- immunity [Clostridium puniceum]